HDEPQPHLQTGAPHNGKSRLGVLAAGSYRSTDHAESRHQRHSRQAHRVCEDGTPRAITRRRVAAFDRTRREVDRLWPFQKWFEPRLNFLHEIIAVYGPASCARTIPARCSANWMRRATSASNSSFEHGCK